MKSPFPGMDPYLEHRWQDVHQRICTYARDQLNEQLGKGLVARLGERLIVESGQRSAHTIYPDVRVLKTRKSESAGPAVAVLEEEVAQPMRVRIAYDPEPQAYIEITELESGQLITAIEFLSASNKKAGNGRKLYKRKQRELYDAGVNLVEIDLLRAGRRVFILTRFEYPDKARAPYYATIIRANQPDIVELYPISLRKPLPSLRIPLRPKDADVVLRLQPLLELAYRNGRYDETDYGDECRPPLEKEDAAWAETLLKEAGKRQ
jgi:hypothetical protein